jgi:TonB family protein
MFFLSNRIFLSSAGFRVFFIDTSGHSSQTSIITLGYFFQFSGQRTMTDTPQSDFPSGAMEIDAFLRQIVESAQAISGATGAAVAIRSGDDRNGEDFLCVARSGDNAPPLGSRLDANSGISGECLLTARVLHCDDSETDHRVDPEVCRELGLRSMVVLPVRGRNRTAGVLEVFSTQPHAFTREHIDSLKRLTEMIEMACASKPDDGLVDLPRTNAPEILVPHAPESAPRSNSWPSRLPFPVSLLKNRRGYWIAGGGQAMLLLLTLIGVEAFHSSTNSDARKQAAQPTVKLSAPETAEIELQPSVGNQANRGRHIANNQNEDERHGLQKASKVEVLNSRGDATSGDHDSGALKFSSNVEAHPQTSSGDPDLAPVLPQSANSIAPEGLLIPDQTMPKLSPAISQGVTGGILDHRVNPVYPPGALAMKLEGDVVLAAVITKTGQVRDLKLVRGSPVLARAAMDAVKQWHYQPYRLNGEPLESQTEITVQFHAK